MNQAVLKETNLCAVITLAGDVQGSGIRPAIANLAEQFDLHGHVRNSRQGVEILLSTSTPRENATIGTIATLISTFAQILRERYPHTKQTLEYSELAEIPSRFEILDSKADGGAQFVVPRDRVVCKACLEECQTRGERRFGYALNSCAQCGPRYSIISAMPYDRQHTSMSLFSMCRECRSEYATPAHRRFHAQTNCCPACGPQVWFESAGGEQKIASAAINAAAMAIAAGQIVALKGLGGYQLVCDATNDHAVSQLRERKGRCAKPLAVMVHSLTEARALAVVDPLEAIGLQSSMGPIVILQSKPDNQLSEQIHPGLNQVGLMLPTTAMHALLLDQVARPLVVTSGNQEGEPLEYEVDGARLRLANIADGFLHHDRPIIRPIDDSVVRCMAGRQVTLRAARGIAPLPLDCEIDGRLTALGGQQKVAIALSNEHRAVLGPHLGDLNSVLSRERFLEQKSALQRLMDSEPQISAHDQHPDFFTSVHAGQLSSAGNLSVQHHHAHVVSGMLEHGWLDREVLGFAFDGTGLGSDGTLWGGEVLLSQTDKFQRVAHVRAFRLVGGERAIAQPWRVAAVLLKESLGAESARKLCRSLSPQWQVDSNQLSTVLTLADADSVSPLTTSMGRLFDGVAAIVGGWGQSSFEGEVAMRLEAICDVAAAGNYSFGWPEGKPFQLDWRPVIRDIVQDLFTGVDPSRIAVKFHRCIANGVVTLAKRFSHLPIVITGGVFQNRVLVELVDEQLGRHRSRVGLPGKIPPNDGGLAAGQLMVAATKIARR